MNRVTIRDKRSGGTKTVSARDAKILVALGKHEYADGAPQTYQTRHMEAAPAPKKRGRPPKSKEL